MEQSTQTVTVEEIDQLVRNLLVDDFDIEPELITGETTLEELDLDSLDIVEIGRAIEQQKGVRIRASDVEGLSNLGEVIETIHRKVLDAGTGTGKAGR